MSKGIIDISMSLDGFVNAANMSPEEPLGDGGQRLHDWAFGSEDPRNGEMLAKAWDVGALIAGRRTYDTSLPGWGADGPTGPARVPTIVVSHDVPAQVPDGGVYTFVTEGIERALQEAKKTAGDKDVGIMGARTSHSSTSGQGWWTRSRSTSCRCRSGAVCGSSSTSAATTYTSSTPG